MEKKKEEKEKKKPSWTSAQQLLAVQVFSDLPAEEALSFYREPIFHRFYRN